MLSGATWVAAVSKAKCTAHIFGPLPGRQAETKISNIASSPEAHR